MLARFGIYRFRVDSAMMGIVLGVGEGSNWGCRFLTVRVCMCVCVMGVQATPTFRKAPSLPKRGRTFDEKLHAFACRLRHWWSLRSVTPCAVTSLARRLPGS